MYVNIQIEIMSHGEEIKASAERRDKHNAYVSNGNNVSQI